MRNRFDVSGKTIIVTGATRGIGRGIASGFAEAGARVVVAGRDAQACTDAANAIREDTGGEAVGMAVDIAQWDAVPAFVDRVCDKFGRLDVLVNNAGLYGLTPILDISSEEWDRFLTVNLKAPLRLSALSVPRMAANGGGSIINVSSMGAYRPTMNASAYASSKAALCNLTRVMAGEWAQFGVRVNTILPGPIRTDMIEGAERQKPGFIDRVAQMTFLKRLGTPDEFVGVALYLASDASAFVTGVDHTVAGGYGI
jgi:NAD(P)-dependent dehydrogenase (short-subunit alcohol dehydrogenase family)